MMLFKECTKCNETKSLSDFYKRRGVKDGHYSHCKTCQKLYSRGWTSTHMSIHSQYVSNWANRNSEKVREYQRKKYRNHYYKSKEICEKYLLGVTVDYFSRANKKSRQKLYDLYNVPRDVRF